MAFHLLTRRPKGLSLGADGGRRMNAIIREWIGLVARGVFQTYRLNRCAPLIMGIGLLSCQSPDDHVGSVRAAVSTLNQPVLSVVDTNPDPKVFEAELSVDEQDVSIAGQVVHAIIYK